MCCPSRDRRAGAACCEQCTCSGSWSGGAGKGDSECRAWERQGAETDGAGVFAATGAGAQARMSLPCVVVAPPTMCVLGRRHWTCVTATRKWLRVCCLVDNFIALHIVVRLQKPIDRIAPTMGQSGSKEDIVKVAQTPAGYQPPLGAVNPVRRQHRSRVDRLHVDLLLTNDLHCHASQSNPLVYFDVKLDRYGEGTKLGRIVMELKAVRASV